MHVSLCVHVCRYKFLAEKCWAEMPELRPSLETVLNELENLQALLCPQVCTHIHTRRYTHTHTHTHTQTERCTELPGPGIAEIVTKCICACVCVCVCVCVCQTGSRDIPYCLQGLPHQTKTSRAVPRTARSRTGSGQPAAIKRWRRPCPWRPARWQTTVSWRHQGRYKRTRAEAGKQSQPHELALHPREKFSCLAHSQRHKLRCKSRALWVRVVLVVGGWHKGEYTHTHTHTHAHTHTQTWTGALLIKNKKCMRLCLGGCAMHMCGPLRGACVYMSVCVCHSTAERAQDPQERHREQAIQPPRPQLKQPRHHIRHGARRACKTHQVHGCRDWQEPSGPDNPVC